MSDLTYFDERRKAEEVARKLRGEPPPSTPAERLAAWKTTKFMLELEMELMKHEAMVHQSRLS